MPRPPLPPLKLSAAERTALEQVVRNPHSSPAAGLRGTAMLMAAEPGTTTKEVAKILGVSPPTIGRWREIYSGAGLGGLISYRERAVRPHLWAGDPNNRVAKILRLQAIILHRRFDSLQERLTEHILTSGHFARLLKEAGLDADGTGAALIKAARHSADVRAWGAAAARGAADVPAVKQAARIDAAVHRIRRADAVTPGDFSILHTLARLGPTGTKQLADAELISVENLTARARDLERRGYISIGKDRVDPSTKLVLTLTATDRTHDLVTGAAPAGIERFVAGYNRLPPQDRADLTEALTKLSAITPISSDPETAQAYRAIATLNRMMNPADPSVLSTRGADALVTVAQSEALRRGHLISPELPKGTVDWITEELDRLALIERITDPADTRAVFLRATPKGHELATALITTPETVTQASFTAAVARLHPDERATLAAGLPRLVELIYS